VAVMRLRSPPVELEGKALERFTGWFRGLPFERKWEYVMDVLSRGAYIYGGFAAAAPFFPWDREITPEKMVLALASLSESRVVLAVARDQFAEASSGLLLGRKVRMRNAFEARRIAFLLHVTGLFIESLIPEITKRACGGDAPRA